MGHSVPSSKYQNLNKALKCYCFFWGNLLLRRACFKKSHSAEKEGRKFLLHSKSILREIFLLSYTPRYSLHDYSSITFQHLQINRC